MSAYARYIFLALYSLFLRFEIFSFRDSPSLHVWNAISLLLLLYLGGCVI